MLLSEQAEKISKSKPETLLDTRNFIDGSEKMDGERHYGYGVDVMRAWAVLNESDKNTFVLREDLDQVREEVKLIRGVLRSLLGNLHDFQTTVDFEDLTPVDQIMFMKVTKFQHEVTTLFDEFNLQKA
jgi:isoleucyl-tRNA synthetase